MKKNLIFIIFFILIITGNVFANKCFPKHTWDLGTEISYIEYKESGIMNNKGMMYSLVGSYTYHDIFMWKVESRYSFGEVDYKSDNTGNMNNVDDYIIHIRGLGGV